MAAQHVSGPVHLFVRIPGNLGNPSGSTGSPTTLYLGTAETHPIVQHVPTWSNVYNDLGGEHVAFDRLFEGEIAVISADVNRFNRLTYNAIKIRPRLSTGVTGQNGPLDVGSLAIGNRLYFELILLYQFFGTANDVGLPPGKRFYACTLEGPDEIRPGTRVEAVRCLFVANRRYNPATRSFELYDENPANFNGLVNLIN